MTSFTEENGGDKKQVIEKMKKRNKNTIQHPLFSSIALAGKPESALDHVYCYLRQKFVGKSVCCACKNLQEYKLGRCVHTFLEVK